MSGAEGNPSSFILPPSSLVLHRPWLRRDWVIFAALAATCLLVFGASLGGAFLEWDDDPNIARNPLYRSGEIGQFWRHPYYGLYVPLTYTVWGVLGAGRFPPHPLPYHAANLLLHVLNAFQVFLLVREIHRRIRPEEEAGRTAAAVFGAFVFLLHPAQAGAVAWISGMRDLLATALALASAREHLAGGWRRAAAAPLLFIAAMLAKPSVVSLPLVLAGLDLLLRERPWRVALRFAPWMAAALVPILVSSGAQRFGMGPPIPPLARPFVAVDAIGFYVKDVFAPASWCLDCGRTPARVMEERSYLGNGAVALASIAAIAMLRRRVGAGFAAGFGGALLAILPVLGLIPFAYQKASTVAGHYLYFPLAGIALAGGAVLLRFGHLRPVQAVSWTAVAALGVLAAIRVPVWHDDEAFFTKMRRSNPESWQGAAGLGEIALQQGRAEDALVLFREAKDRAPLEGVALRDVMLALEKLGRYGQIVAENRSLLESLDRRAQSPEIAPYLAFMNVVLADAELHLGDHDASLQSVCRALQYRPFDEDTLRRIAETTVALQKRSGRDLECIVQ